MSSSPLFPPHHHHMNQTNNSESTRLSWFSPNSFQNGPQTEEDYELFGLLLGAHTSINLHCNA